jgi:hypothetical protein
MYLHCRDGWRVRARRCRLLGVLKCGDYGEGAVLVCYQACWVEDVDFDCLGRRGDVVRVTRGKMMMVRCILTTRFGLWCTRTIGIATIRRKEHHTLDINCRVLLSWPLLVASHANGKRGLSPLGMS